jgi:S-formylglutathione hydrolase FrmB
MSQKEKCVVITPDDYAKKKLHFPVLYLLHGYGGCYNSWILHVPALGDLSDQYGMIIVCPDGGRNSWYFDHPTDSLCRYETYLSTELVSYVDEHYRTVPDRQQRAVAGLSMGGHGALYLMLRHPDVFGAAGSMSGGLDLRPFTARWEIMSQLGDTLAPGFRWDHYSVYDMLISKAPQGKAIIIDCGTEDIFYEVHRRIHQRLLELGIPHEYVERPGKHEWNYWISAVRYQVLFFHHYFQEYQKEIKQ